MTSSEVLDRLRTLGQDHTVRLGLSRMARMRRALGNPDTEYPIVHVGGTNGKGSVSTKIAACCSLSGLKVGLYTSPHLSTFRERICYNNEPIPLHQAEAILAQIFSVMDSHRIDASFFEVLTMAALIYFANQQVDVAVLEVGLGGRLDATNVVSPILSVITSIALDHCSLLGKTRQLIAQEKGGIIKKGVPIVLGPTALGVGLEEIAAKQEAKVIPVDDSFSDYLLENQAIAAAAVEQLRHRLPITKEGLQRGLKNTLGCRFEQHTVPVNDRTATVLFDVAHNPQGLSSLFTAIQCHLDKPLRIVAGFSNLTQVPECLAILFRQNVPVHLVDTNHPRFHPYPQLLQYVQQGAYRPATPSGSLTTVLPHALELAAQRSELLVICGSCYMMHDAKQILGIQSTDNAVWHQRTITLPKAALSSVSKTSHGAADV